MPIKQLYVAKIIICCLSSLSRRQQDFGIMLGRYNRYNRVGVCMYQIPINMRICRYEIIENFAAASAV